MPRASSLVYHFYFQPLFPLCFFPCYSGIHFRGTQRRGIIFGREKGRIRGYFRRIVFTESFYRFLFRLAKLITDEQNEEVKNQRRLEIKQRQEIYQWGDDPDYRGLPGFIKSKNARTLPKDAQFTQEDADELLRAKHKGIFNSISIFVRGLFYSWYEFDDFRRVSYSTYPVH